MGNINGRNHDHVVIVTSISLTHVVSNNTIAIIKVGALLLPLVMSAIPSPLRSSRSMQRSISREPPALTVTHLPFS